MGLSGATKESSNRPLSPQTEPNLVHCVSLFTQHNYSIELNTETGTALHLTSHLFKPSLSFSLNESGHFGLSQSGTECRVKDQVHPHVFGTAPCWLPPVHRHGL